MPLSQTMGPLRASHLLTMLAGTLLAALVLLGGCAAVPEEAEKDQGPPMWPRPPEQPRFQYIYTLRSAADIYQETSTDSLRHLALGDTISTQPVFEKPSGIAAGQGRIYITDTVRRNVTVFDITRRKIFQFGQRAPGQISKPIGIALDKQGNIYVADATLRKVLVFDSLGLYLREITGDFLRPVGVAVSQSGDRVYVIDRASNESDQHRVYAFDGAGKKLFEIGKRGKAPGEFNVPVQGVVAPDDTLYVLDAGNFRVQAFDKNGKFLRTWGKNGNGLGDFARPRGITTDKDGNVYVVDGMFGNVQVFTPQGQLLIPFGEVAKQSSPGKYGLPMAIAMDEADHLFIVDQYYRKVEVIKRLTDEEGKKLQQEAAAKPKADATP